MQNSTSCKTVKTVDLSINGGRNIGDVIRAEFFNRLEIETLMMSSKLTF